MKNTAALDNRTLLPVMTRTLVRLLTLLGLWNVYYQLLHWLPANLVRLDHGRDMMIYYDAAQKATAGLSMYHHASSSYGPHEFPTWYVYPPQLGALISTFAGHPRAFNDFWYPLMLASFWTFAFALSRVSVDDVRYRDIRLPARLGAILAWGGAISLTPYLYYTMSVGQVEPVLWAAIALTVIVRWPNVFLAVMASIKPYAVWPLVAYSAKNRKSILVTVAVIVTGALLAALRVGAWQFAEWFGAVGPSAGQGSFIDFNWSLSMAVLRLLRAAGWWHYSSGPLHAGPRLFLGVMGVAGPSLVYVVTRRMELRARMVLLYIAGMLFSPLCWAVYLTTLWIPLAMWVRARSEGISRAASNLQA